MEIPLYLLGGAGGSILGAAEYFFDKNRHMDEESRLAFQHLFGFNVEYGHLVNTALWIIIGMATGGAIEIVTKFAR